MNVAYFGKVFERTKVIRVAIFHLSFRLKCITSVLAKTLDELYSRIVYAYPLFMTTCIQY